MDIVDVVRYIFTRSMIGALIQYEKASLHWALFWSNEANVHTPSPAMYRQLAGL